jgi:paraquat-inducible protein A
MSGATMNRSLAGTYRAQTPAIVALLLAAFAFLVAGLLRPFTQVTKLWVFEDQISVLKGLGTLWGEGEMFLFFILLIFTVCFPILKIFSLLTLWLKAGLTRERLELLHRLVSHLGKWSMLDVFIVAILVLAMRSGGLGEIQIQDGLFLFCTSVLLTQIGSLWIGHIARRQLDT